MYEPHLIVMFKKYFKTSHISYNKYKQLCYFYYHLYLYIYDQIYL